MRNGLLLICIVIFASFQAHAQSSVFEQIKDKFAQGQMYESRFEHQFIDSYTGEVQENSGTLVIDSVGYRLETDAQVIVVDGKLSKAYEEARNRLIISPYEPEDDSFGPSRFLSGVDSTYQLTEKKNDDGTTTIILTSTDDFAEYTQVEIWVDQVLRPLLIIAIDSSENEISTRFSAGGYKPRNPASFELDFPDDAEIIDMRFE
ncbi:MAG: outer membrane lipoprotein carrier protein LolA [Bacteroidota bacterium]